MTVEAYPLEWPAGVPRSEKRERAKFGKQTRTEHGWSRRSELSVAQAMSRLSGELERLGASSIVLSTNLELRLDGLPRSGRRSPDDPGVACYFTVGGEQHCMPCDRWDRVADNIAAIAKHVESVRGQLRWGVGDVKAAFAGFKALPAPKKWFEVLGVPPDAGVDDVERAYKSLAIIKHPDRPGGSHDAMAEINKARQEFQEL